MQRFNLEAGFFRSDGNGCKMIMIIEITNATLRFRAKVDGFSLRGERDTDHPNEICRRTRDKTGESVMERMG